MALDVKVKFTDSINKLPENLRNTVKDEYLKAATVGSAGIDLRYCGSEELVIQANDCVLVGSGLAIFINNSDYVGMVFPRSGLGNKGLIIGNLTGIIDSDYQGELGLSLWNRTDKAIHVTPGERVCQYLIVPRMHANYEVVDEFDMETERGEKGFGHSGTH